MSNRTKAQLEKDTVRQRAEIKILRKALDRIGFLHYVDPINSYEDECLECGGTWPCESKKAVLEAREQIDAHTEE